MKLESALKKLRQYGFQVNQPAARYGGYRAILDGSDYLIEFNAYDGRVDAYRVRHHRDQDDSHTDYYAGHYVNSLDEAIRSATSERKRVERVGAVTVTAVRCLGKRLKPTARFQVWGKVPAAYFPDQESLAARLAHGQGYTFQQDDQEAADSESLAMAEGFLQGGDAGVLLDWLMERYPSVFAFVQHAME